MARSNYSAGKRQKENERAKKKRDKAERKRQRSESGGGTDGIPIASVEELQGLSSDQSDEEAQRVMDAAVSTGSPEEGESRRSATVPSRLFVGGLSWGSTDEDLKEVFSKCGTVAEAIIITDRDTGDSRGFGFVTMQDRRDAAKAIKDLNGSELHGRTIVVKAATERPAR